MKKGNLKRVLPYETDYNLLSLCRKWESFGLWMIGILSIILPIFGAIPECTNLDIFYSTLKFLYFIAIIAYYILDIYTETFLYPATARKRRKGFIDNSLGSKYLEKKGNALREPF